MPVATVTHPGPNAVPPDTAPHPKAHIGGNHVMGFSSSRTAPGEGDGASARKAE
jgi:hypothetical protein